MESFKRSFLTLIILNLLKDHGELHGYGIAQAVKQRSGGQFELQVGTLYPLLYQLERNGFIVAKMKTSPRGRERPYFYLTDEGKRLLGEERQTWVKLGELAGLKLREEDHGS